MQKKILIHSAAPWCPTGYGQQCQQLALRLKADGHDVHVSAYHGLQGAPLTWNGLRIWPGASDYGTRMLPRYIKSLKPDLTLTLQDVWTLKGRALRGANLGSWIPVDHEPLGAPLEKFIRDSQARPIAMSRHGERMMLDRDIEPLYVPHAIDTKVFRPRDKAASRQACQIPETAFVVAMVATNMDNGPARKGWIEALLAFKAFRDRHDDALLYFHTDLTGQHLGGGDGLELAWDMEQIGIKPEWIRVTDPLAYDLGIPADELAELYSAADVLLSPSYGEGFGICVIEAQACGTPVIVSNFTAQPELVGGGWCVEGDRTVRIRHYRAWWQAPSVEGIVTALEQAYEHAGNAGLRQAAVDHAAAYDADRVYNEHWRPAIEKLLPPATLRRRERRREKATA